MRDIIQAPDASSDLASYYSYIAEDNPDAARRFASATEKTFALLAEMPDIGVLYPVKNLRLKSLRKFSIRDFKKYLVFYLPFDNGIHIIRVLHSARDIRKIMGYDK